MSSGGGLIRSPTFGVPDPFAGQTVSVGVAEPTFDLNESATLVTGGHTVGQAGGDSNAFCSGSVVRADPNYVVPPGGGLVTSFSFQSGSRNTASSSISSSCERHEAVTSRWLARPA